MSFELRGKRLWLESAVVYPRCRQDVEPLFELNNAAVTAEAIVLASRKRGSLVQEPYVYIGEGWHSSVGFWLNEASYVTEVEPVPISQKRPPAGHDPGNGESFA